MSHLSPAFVMPEKIASLSSFCPDLDTAKSKSSLSTILDDSHGSRSSLQIKVVSDDIELNAARLLVSRRYGWRGYGHMHGVPASPNHATFIAIMNGDLVGTLTLEVDSPRGMTLDNTFRDELNTYRRVPNTRLCELTRFAFESSLPNSKQVLAALFHYIFIWGECHFDCSDLFIEVGPRHRRFYEVMLNFNSIGSMKSNQDVGSAAQLMHLKVADIRDMVDEMGSSLNARSTRSLYPFFFSRDSERKIRSAIRSELHHVQRT